jgi:hypothetical protein
MNLSAESREATGRAQRLHHRSSHGACSRPSRRQLTVLSLLADGAQIGRVIALRRLFAFLDP